MIKATVNIKQAQQKIKKIKSQADYTTSVMLNMLAADVAKAEEKAMVRQLDRPTPWTQKAFKGVGKYPFAGIKANKRRLYAVVQAKKIQEAYLAYQVHGGSRGPNNKAIPIAVGQKRNKYGNIPRGSIKRNIANAKTFSGVPHGRTTAGVYKRMGTKKNPKLRLMVKWHDQSVSYSKRFDFYGTAQHTVKAQKIKRWKEAKQLAMRTAR